MPDQTATQETQTETVEQGIQAAFEDAVKPADGKPEEKSAEAQAEDPAEDAPKEDAPKNKDKNEPENKSDPAESGEDDAPITDWGKVDLQLPKDAAIDEDLLASFGEISIKEKLTGKQAKALAMWQLEAVKKAEEARKAAYEDYIEKQADDLKKAWGRKAKDNQDKILNLVRQISEQDGLKGFEETLSKTGALNNALVLKGLLHLANRLDEDGLGSGSGSGGGLKEETELEGIEDAFRQARKGY